MDIKVKSSGYLDYTVTHPNPLNLTPNSNLYWCAKYGTITEIYMECSN